MKTMEQWRESKEDFTKFAKPGDEIDEEIYFYFLEVLPPAKMTGYGFLVGEPYDHNEDNKPLYAAFYNKPAYDKPDDRYYYGGHKTIREF